MDYDERYLGEDSSVPMGRKTGCGVVQAINDLPKVTRSLRDTNARCRIVRDLWEGRRPSSDSGPCVMIAQPFQPSDLRTGQHCIHKPFFPLLAFRLFRPVH
jgi:hypothetical protein